MFNILIFVFSYITDCLYTQLQINYFQNGYHTNYLENPEKLFKFVDVEAEMDLLREMPCNF